MALCLQHNGKTKSLFYASLRKYGREGKPKISLKLETKVKEGKTFSWNKALRI